MIFIFLIFIIAKYVMVAHGESNFAKLGKTVLY